MWKKKTTDLKKKSPNLKNKLDTVFSRFIRLRDARKDGTFQCISCGRILPLDQADCGHYINRQHMSTRFSEKNCNAQCRSCNRFDEGNMQGYRRGLILKYGEPAVLCLNPWRIRQIRSPTLSTVPWSSIIRARLNVWKKRSRYAKYDIYGTFENMKVIHVYLIFKRRTTTSVLSVPFLSIWMKPT